MNKMQNSTATKDKIKELDYSALFSINAAKMEIVNSKHLTFKEKCMMLRSRVKQL